MKRPAGRLFVLLDASYRDDERFVALADPMGELLWVRALAWSKARNTDGVIPSAILRRLADDLLGETADLVAGLVAVGLWEEAESGWRFPSESWARWQTTAEEQEAQRTAKAERQARYRARQRDGKSSTDRRATSGRSSTQRHAPSRPVAARNERAETHDAPDACTTEPPSQTGPANSHNGTATPGRPSTESSATPRSPSQSHSQLTSDYLSSDTSSRPQSSRATTDDKVLEVARVLAERDLELRVVELGQIRQPARWLTVAAARRLEQDGERIAELLASHDDRVDAVVLELTPLGESSPAARVRRARLNGAHA